MPVHLLFVAEYAPDCIEVSDRRRPPRFEDRPTVGRVHRPFKLSRVWVEADDPPRPPAGDLDERNYRAWLSLLPPHRVEEVSDRLFRGADDGDFAWLRLDWHIRPVELVEVGTALELTLTNAGPHPIGRRLVRWVMKVTPIHAGETERWVWYNFGSHGEAPGQLLRGESHAYVLLKPEVNVCLRHCNGHPPDDYYIAVEAGCPGDASTREVLRIPGADLGEHVRECRRPLRTEGH